MRRDDRADDPSKLGKVLAFMQVLWALTHGLESRSKRMRSELGITGPQRLVLQILKRCPGMGSGQLAKVMHLHPSTLTGIIKRLSAAGFVERVADPADGRKFYLYLTALGKRSGRISRLTVESSVKRVMAKAPPDDLEAAARVLSLLATELR